MNLRLIVIALVVAGCGKSTAAKPDPAACRAACEHMLELAMADLDKSATATTDPALAEITAKLKAKALASRASDLTTCETQCLAGKLDTRCGQAATTIDEAMTCTNRNGGQR